MDPKLYLQIAKTEDVHWWFVARRIILDKLIAKLPLAEGSDILEAGCGTGGNLAMLARYGQVYAMELDAIARRFASSRAIGSVQPGHLPDDIPFADKQFDLVVLLDVLEHLAQDSAALKALRLRLKPGGWLLVTVPANQWMWSRHDEFNHHQRRYAMRELRRVTRNAGFEVCYISYFNVVLFPLIAGIRLLQNWFGQEVQESDIKMPSGRVNQILTALFASERYLIGQVSIPFGVSLVLLAQHPST